MANDPWAGDPWANDPWNGRFSAEHYIYGTEPNAYLAAAAGRLRPGMTALAVADGEGRNGVWLARQGLDVLSVDRSSVGLDKARRLAREHGVELRTELADLAGWDWPRDRFDVVAAIFAHFPPDPRPAIHRAMAAALKPGGILVLEAFAKTQLGKPSGGPPVPELLYDRPSLEADFAGLEILEILEGTVMLDEGTHHRGPGEVVRVLARRAE